MKTLVRCTVCRRDNGPCDPCQQRGYCTAVASVRDLRIFFEQLPIRGATADRSVRVISHVRTRSVLDNVSGVIAVIAIDVYLLIAAALVLMRPGPVTWSFYVFSHRLRGALLLPMSARGELIGFIACGSKRDHTRYLPSEIETLAAMAHRVGTAYVWLTLRPATMHLAQALP